MKRILVLNLFPTGNPPVTGGQIRYFHIYDKLSQYYDVTLLSQSFRKETVEFSPSFREYRVPKDPRHYREVNRLKKELACDASCYELNLIKNIKLSAYPTVYHKFYEDLYPSSDIIIHETPYMLKYDKYMGTDRKPRIYNSHNHDFLLAKQIWKNERAKKYLKLVYTLEEKLTKGAALVFATSEREKQSFINMYNLEPRKVKLAPNGINPEEWFKRQDKSDGIVKALFIGAHYPPNIEAIEYIVNHLADKCPQIEFIIAGGCCTVFQNTNKPNVKLLGRVSHNKKRRLFSAVNIAINPIVSGGGINLKTLEFLSAGLPLFSTEFGIRGLDLLEQEHYIKAELADFPDKITELCHNPQLLKPIALCGQKYINAHYSWNKIADDIRNEIEKLELNQCHR